MLRAYQQRAIDQLYDWMKNNEGNPCLVLPTGSGKSHIIAAICKDALQNWPETRILMLTHVKELIEQNAEKLRSLWPGAPMGIYSASIGKRELGEPITFAGIQSVRNKARMIGGVDLIIIDESHFIGHKDEGGYRKLIAELTEINPHLRVIGLTATPYRLGHGLITDKPAIFDRTDKH
jgi:DNA repair protein RadD